MFTIERPGVQLQSQGTIGDGFNNKDVVEKKHEQFISFIYFIVASAYIDIKIIIYKDKLHFKKYF